MAMVAVEYPKGKTIEKSIQLIKKIMEKPIAKRSGGKLKKGKWKITKEKPRNLTKILETYIITNVTLK